MIRRAPRVIQQVTDENQKENSFSSPYRYSETQRQSTDHDQSFLPGYVPDDTNNEDGTFLSSNTNPPSPIALKRTFNSSTVNQDTAESNNNNHFIITSPPAADKTSRNGPAQLDIVSPLNKASANNTRITSTHSSPSKAVSAFELAMKFAASSLNDDDLFGDEEEEEFDYTYHHDSKDGSSVYVQQKLNFSGTIGSTSANAFHPVSILRKSGEYDDSQYQHSRSSSQASSSQQGINSSTKKKKVVLKRKLVKRRTGGAGGGPQNKIHQATTERDDNEEDINPLADTIFDLLQHGQDDDDDRRNNSAPTPNRLRKRKSSLMQVKQRQILRRMETEQEYDYYDDHVHDGRSNTLTPEELLERKRSSDLRSVTMMMQPTRNSSRSTGVSMSGGGGGRMLPPRKTVSMAATTNRTWPDEYGVSSDFNISEEELMRVLAEARQLSSSQMLKKHSSRSLMSKSEEGVAERILRKERERQWRLVDRAKIIARRLLREADQDIEVMMSKTASEQAKAEAVERAMKMLEEEGNNNNHLATSAATLHQDPSAEQQQQQGEEGEESEDEETKRRKLIIQKAEQALEDEMNQKLQELNSKLEKRTSAIRVASSSLDAYQQAQKEKPAEIFELSHVTKRHKERKKKMLLGDRLQSGTSSAMESNVAARRRRMVSKGSESRFLSRSTLASRGGASAELQHDLISSGEDDELEEGEEDDEENESFFHYTQSEGYELCREIVEDDIVGHHLNRGIDEVHEKMELERLNGLDSLNSKEAERREILRKQASLRMEGRRAAAEAAWLLGSHDPQLTAIRQAAMARRKEEAKRNKEQLEEDMKLAEERLHLVSLKIDPEYRKKYQATEAAKMMAPKDLADFKAEMEALEREEKEMQRKAQQEEDEKNKEQARKEEVERQEREVEDAERVARELEERINKISNLGASSNDITGGGQHGSFAASRSGSPVARRLESFSPKQASLSQSATFRLMSSPGSMKLQHQLSGSPGQQSLSPRGYMTKKNSNSLAGKRSPSGQMKMMARTNSNGAPASSSSPRGGQSPTSSYRQQQQQNVANAANVSANMNTSIQMFARNRSSNTISSSLPASRSPSHSRQSSMSAANQYYRLGSDGSQQAFARQQEDSYQSRQQDHYYRTSHVD